MWGEDFSGDESWSSESEGTGAPAGYMLLQNEASSDEESHADFDPREQDASASAVEVVETSPISSDETPWVPFKAISAEEEERLRLEAFAQFDRNYAAVCPLHSLSSWNP